MRARVGAVCFFAGGTTLFASIAWAECYCDQGLPLFERDPLVTADSGITSIVTSAMVEINEAGECYVDNSDGFEPELQAHATFFFGGTEYRQVFILRSPTNTEAGQWATMAELNEWALLICLQRRLIG